MSTTAVVILNWNGLQDTIACLKSVERQVKKPDYIILVDNGSVDNSVTVLRSTFPTVEVISEPANLGFAGGVNVGIRRAKDLGCGFVGLLNNDAVASPEWLSELSKLIESDDYIGIVTSRLLDESGTRFDSTGQAYTHWGLPYSMGRGEVDKGQVDEAVEVFGASGGASLYRMAMLDEIGLFDESFFAYYEDVDVSFRAQLAGWKVWYCPESVAYHQIGATSKRIKGFLVYQTMKNLPLLAYKNVPEQYFWGVMWRLKFARILFFCRAVSRGQGWPALKGISMAKYLLVKKRKLRHQIQANKKVSDDYIWNLMTHDLPPNAHALRKLRATWWKITGKGGRKK